MREIKYRAWDRSRKVMMSVRSINYADDGYAGTTTVQSIDGTSYVNGESCDLIQYTGIKDKNGIEIYEGDILKAEDGYTGLINYRLEAAQFVGFNVGDKYVNEEFDTLYNIDGTLNTAEVIGNRYDNPEFVKGAEV